MASSRSPRCPQKRKVFFGNFIHSVSLGTLEYLHDATVCVDEKGVIVSIKDKWSVLEHGALDSAHAAAALLSWRKEDVEVCLSGEDGFFFPGLVDTHIHAPQYPNVGIFGTSTLLDWLKTYTFPLEASFSSLSKATQIYTRVVSKTISHGTTCAAYFATIHVPATNALANICLRAGQRALVGRVCMDELAPGWYRDESCEAAMRDTTACVDHIQAIDPEGETVRPVVTPRFAPSCSVDLMRRLGQMAEKRDVAIQTHVSENPSEIELVRRAFPRDKTGARDDSYTAVYDTFGLLTPRTILAHGVHLSASEAALISARGAGISHCPCSNTSITSGAARIRWLLDQDVKVGLGTDMSGGYSPSVLEAARQAVLVSRHLAMGGDEKAKLSVEEVLHLATRGGADLVGLGRKVGGFEVGMEWDALLIGLGRVDANGGGGDGNVDVFGWESWPERVSKWVYNGDDRNVRRVWVRGRLVHDRGGGREVEKEGDRGTSGGVWEDSLRSV